MYITNLNENKHLLNNLHMNIHAAFFRTAKKTEQFTCSQSGYAHKVAYDLAIKIYKILRHAMEGILKKL